MILGFKGSFIISGYERLVDCDGVERYVYYDEVEHVDEKRRLELEELKKLPEQLKVAIEFHDYAQANRLIDIGILVDINLYSVVFDKYVESLSEYVFKHNIKDNLDTLICGIKKIIDKGCNVDQKINTPAGRSLLSYLTFILAGKPYKYNILTEEVENKVIELVKFLVFNGADINFKPDQCRSPLVNAREYDKINKDQSGFVALAPKLQEWQKEAVSIKDQATKIIQDHTGMLEEVANVVCEYLK